MRKRIALLLGAVLVIGAAFFTVRSMSGENVDRIADEMLKALHEQGFAQVQEVSIKDKEVCFTAKYDPDEVPNWKRTFLLSAERTEARNQAVRHAGAFREITSMRQVILDTAGKTVYDTSLADFWKIPEGNPDSVRIRENKSTYTKEETAAALREELTRNGIPLEVRVCGSYVLGGYLAELVFRNDGGQEPDLQAIHAAVENCLTAVDAVNRAGYSIGAYQIEYRPADGADPLYVLTADLIFRDFRRWQDPSLGNESRTGGGPKMP